MRWGRFLVLVVATHLGLNVLFALAFLACGQGQLAGPVFEGVSQITNEFLRAFFFSVETFGTIGFGNIVPVGVASASVMTVESIVSLLCVALVTGLVFTRFSKPTARILYSKSAIITPYREIQGLMFRCANKRTNQLIEVSMQVLYSRLEEKNGVRTRVFTMLPLEFDKVTFFTLSWTVVHPINDASPLYECTPEDLAANHAEFLVLLTGIDDTSAQTVHSRTSYKPHEVSWGVRFRPMFVESSDAGTIGMDLSRIHDVEPVGEVRPGSRTI